MQVAYSAWSLAAFAPRRFQLGLGTQIKPNIVGRFGVEWADPVERMADYVDAVRAIFTAFQEGGPLRHEGPHYRLTRLQPEFNPGPLEEGPLPIWLGGVNRRACRLAGASADGYVTHPTNSDRRYLGELCLPAIEEGLASAGRDRADVQVVAGGMVATGRDDAAVEEARNRSRYMLGFLFSTPAYRRTLELHGWEDLGDRLRSMTKEGRWDDLEAAVTDEVLDAVVASGRYDQLAQVLGDRYADVADGVLLHPRRTRPTTRPSPTRSGAPGVSDGSLNQRHWPRRGRSGVSRRSQAQRKSAQASSVRSTSGMSRWSTLAARSASPSKGTPRPSATSWVWARASSTPMAAEASGSDVPKTCAARAEGGAARTAAAWTHAMERQTAIRPSTPSSSSARMVFGGPSGERASASNGAWPGATANWAA